MAKEINTRGIPRHVLLASIVNYADLPPEIVIAYARARARASTSGKNLPYVMYLRNAGKIIQQRRKAKRDFKFEDLGFVLKDDSYELIDFSVDPKAIADETNRVVEYITLNVDLSLYKVNFEEYDEINGDGMGAEAVANARKVAEEIKKRKKRGKAKTERFPAYGARSKPHAKKHLKGVSGKTR